MRNRLLITLASLLVAISAHGQGASRLSNPPVSDRKKDLLEAAEKLRQAKDNMDLEKAKGAAKALMDKLPGGATDAARSALQSPEAKAQAIEAMKSAAQALAPEAQKLLNKTDLPAPSAAAVATQQTPEGPKPQALQPIADTAHATRQPSVIIESDNSVFDLKAGIFIYTGHVRARHPQFYIECEELEVHMVKDEDKQDKKAAPKNSGILANGEQKPGESGIRIALARGPMVSIEKKSEQGDIQQGRCRRLLYEAATGDITLSDNPQVQRGDVLHIAAQPDTVMIFDKNGKLRTTGRTRTIKSGVEDQPAAPAPGGTPGGL